MVALLCGMDIRTHLRAKCLTQRDIAQRLNVSDATVCKWLSRKHPVPIRLLKPLAGFIGVKVDVLLAALEPSK